MLHPDVLAALVEIPEADDGDGLTLYRALARLETGDSANFKYVLNQVLHHYLHVWGNPEHPLRKNYHEREERFHGSHSDQAFFALLSYPDLCSLSASLSEVLPIIADALGIRLVVHDSSAHGHPATLWEGGPVSFPEYHVSAKTSASMLYFSSLVEDGTGKPLIEHLLRVKEQIMSRQSPEYEDLDLREMRWFWKDRSQAPFDDAEHVDSFGSRLECWNEYLPVQPEGEAEASDVETEAMPNNSSALLPVESSNSVEGKTVSCPDDAGPVVADAVAPVVTTVEDSNLVFDTDDVSEDHEQTPETATRYRTADPPSLENELNSFCIFTVVVKKPQEIRPALRLLIEALARAPAQRLPVPTALHTEERATGYRNPPHNRLRAGPRKPLKPYVGIDAEFAKRSLPEDFPYDQRMPIRGWQANGATEELCSVIGIAVDRHLCFLFYILDMLENAEDSTVAELQTESIIQLSYFFQETIFNPDLLKVWFNYQSDIIVIDDTIAHMFQKTPRPKRTFRSWNDGYGFIDEQIRGAQAILPTWKICKPQLEVFERPESLTFSKEAIACPFHESHDCNYRTDIACPCGRYGNVDITMILSYIVRPLGLPPFRHIWQQNPKHYSYDSLLKYFFGTEERLFPLLEHLKNARRRCTNPNGFYESLGPGMETDDDMMGYNIGDIVGIALIFRFITTTDDRLLRLFNFSQIDRSGYIPSQGEKRAVAQRIQSVAATQGIPLIEDNPRLWSFRSLEDVPMADRPGIFWLGDTTGGSIFHSEGSERSLVASSYFEHERRGEVVKDALAKTDARPPTPEDPRWKMIMGWEMPSPVTPVPPDERSPIKRRKYALSYAHRALFDPCRLSFPADICCFEPVKVLGSIHFEPPVVRAGMLYSDQLVEMLRSKRTYEIEPPRGFLASSDEEFGLPPSIGRRPSDTLERAQELLHTFKSGKDIETSALLPCADPTWESGRRVEGPPQPLLSVSTSREQRRNRRMERDCWIEDAKYGVANMVAAMEKEQQRIAAEGEPTGNLADDVLDYEGRDYGLQLSQAPRYLQPLFWRNRPNISAVIQEYKRAIVEAENLIEKVKRGRPQRPRKAYAEPTRSSKIRAGKDSDTVHDDSGWSLTRSITQEAQEKLTGIQRRLSRIMRIHRNRTRPQNEEKAEEVAEPAAEATQLYGETFYGLDENGEEYAYIQESAW